LRVQASAARVTTKHFVLLIAAQERIAFVADSVRFRESAPPRLGLVVSRKIGGAVARNRVKRLCRECFRLHPDLLPKEVDMIAIARRGADSLKLQEVREEWGRVAVSLRRVAAEALARTQAPPHACPEQKPVDP
jgi:ribonuclease P protein component